MKKIVWFFLLFSFGGLSALISQAEIGLHGKSDEKSLAPQVSLRLDEAKSALSKAPQQDTSLLPRSSEAKREPIVEESSLPPLSFKNVFVLQKNSLLKRPERDNSVQKSSPLSLSLENSFALQKNSLLKEPEDWTLKIPYTEVHASYRFSGQSLFKMGFDVSYQNKDWAYSVDSLFVRHEWTAWIPLSFQAGWFFYPVSYFEENEKLFAKRPLAQKSLFPSGRDRGMGILLEGNVFGSFYLRGAVMAPEGAKDIFRKTRTRPAFIGSFIYRKKDQNFFMSLLQKDFFLEGEETALGFGLDRTYKAGSWLFGARGEFWDIKRSQPARVLFSYYLFPYLKWRFIFFGALFGGSHHYLKEDQSHAFEYILKGGVYATENLFFTVERIYEKDSLTQNNSWAFSLKTEFKIY